MGVAGWKMMRLGAKALMSSYSARVSSNVSVSPLVPPPVVGVEGGVVGGLDVSPLPRGVAVGAGVGVDVGWVWTGSPGGGPTTVVGVVGGGPVGAWATAPAGQRKASRRASRKKTSMQLRVRERGVANMKLYSPINEPELLRGHKDADG